MLTLMLVQVFGLTEQIIQVSYQFIDLDVVLQFDDPESSGASGIVQKQKSIFIRRGDEAPPISLAESY